MKNMAKCTKSNLIQIWVQFKSNSNMEQEYSRISDDDLTVEVIEKARFSPHSKDGMKGKRLGGTHGEEAGEAIHDGGG